MTLVAAAGPLSNLILAFLLAIPFKVGVLDWTPLSLNRIAHVMTGGFKEGIADVIGLMIFFNLILAVFNLIPLAPLDGSKVVGGLIPRHQAAAYARLERNGPLILMGIILMDYAFGLGILWGIIGPVVDSLRSAAIG
jgi:Zn-dependent protease